MLYPKFPQRYLAAIVVCLILTLGCLGALFLIYLFTEGRSPLVPDNGGAGAGTATAVVSVKLTLGAQQQLQLPHEVRQPQQKRIYLQQPVALLHANEDDDDDEVIGGGDGGGDAGDSITDSAGDASARFQPQHGSESDYLEDEDMLNIDDNMGAARGGERQQYGQQQHFVDDNYQLQHMLGAVVDDNEEPPPQSKRERLPPKLRPQTALDEMPLRMAHVSHAALVAGVGSPELGVDDDEDDDLGDDYDISISAELWRQRKQPHRQQVSRPSDGTLALDVQRRDNNYDTIYIDDFERAPATPSGLKTRGGSLQRPDTASRDELANMEISDINYFDAIIDGGERDGKGATIGGEAAAAAPATAATTLIMSGTRPLKLQKLQKQQRRKNRQQRKNLQLQPQPLRSRYNEMTVSRRVPMYYLNILYSKHKHHNNNKDRRPVSVDDVGGDDEDADGDGEEAYFVGSGSGAGALRMDGFTFRDVDADGEEAEEIEDDSDAAETAEFIKRINSKMRQAAKSSGRYGNSNNSNNNNNNKDISSNCDNSNNYNTKNNNNINDNKNNGNNNKNNSNNNTYKERKHSQKMLKERDGCANSRKTSTAAVAAAAAAEVSGGKHYTYELRAQNSNGNGSSNNVGNNNSNNSRSSAVIEAIDFYNLSSELVSNLSAPQLYQDEKFVSNIRTVAAAAAMAATTIATPSTATVATADSGAAIKKSAAAAETLSLRAAVAAAATATANSNNNNNNNNKHWPAASAAAVTVATVTETAATASNRQTALEIAEPQQPVAINVTAAEMPAATNSGGDNARGTHFNSAAWLETRTRRIIGNVKKSEERSRQLLLCEEAGGGELCRMLFKGHLNE